MAYIEYDGQEFYYNEYGSGEICLLFIHGLGGNHTLWKHQIDYFRNRYKVISVDLFGHGGSSKAFASKSALELNTGALNHLISQNIKTPVIVMGHSLAGSVLLELYKLHPQKLKGLVFVDSTYLGLKNIINMHNDFSRRLLEWPNDRLKEKVGNFYHNLIGENTSDENKSLILTAMTQCNPRWLFEYAVSCGEFYLKNPPEKLSINSNLPVLVVEAGHGVSSNFSKSWINLFRTADYYLFENSYHYFFIDKFVRFNKLLDDFIGGML